MRIGNCVLFYTEEIFNVSNEPGMKFCNYLATKEGHMKEIVSQYSSFAIFGRFSTSSKCF